VLRDALIEVLAPGVAQEARVLQASEGSVDRDQRARVLCRGALVSVQPVRNVKVASHARQLEGMYAPSASRNPGPREGTKVTAHYCCIAGELVPGRLAGE